MRARTVANRKLAREQSRLAPVHSRERMTSNENWLFYEYLTPMALVWTLIGTGSLIGIWTLYVNELFK
jgi:hypothetical protein